MSQVVINMFEMQDGGHDVKPVCNRDYVIKIPQAQCFLRVFGIGLGTVVM